MIVDASVHVWDDDTARYPWSPLDGVDVPAAAAPAAGMLADLARAGVGAAVCVQPRSNGYDHTYLGAAIRDFPGGCDGLAGAALDPLLERAARLGASASLLVDPDRLAAVGAVAARHPSTAFIVDHLGLCTPATPADEVAGLIALARLSNVSVRLSALTALSADGYPFADLHPLVRSVYEAFGAGRLLWGTDYPYVLDSGSYRQSLEAVAAGMPFIDPADLPANLGGNAARIYRLAA